jgi:hypothetical protein
VDGDNVQPDGHVWPDGEDERETVEVGRLLQRQNRKAAGPSQLYQSIRTNTTEGKMAISRIIKPYFDSAKNGGYVAGHFKKAWTALIAWYKVVKRKDEDTLRSEYYYSKNMKSGQQPSAAVFILELEEIRAKFELAGYVVSPKKFVKRNKKGVGPYSIKKAKIQKKLDEIKDDVFLRLWFVTGLSAHPGLVPNLLYEYFKKYFYKLLVAQDQTEIWPDCEYTT